MNRVLRFSLSLLVCLSLTIACQNPAVAEDVALETEQQKILYAIGLAVSQQLAPLGLEAADLEFVQAGLADAVLKKEAKVDLQEFGPKIQAFAQERVAAAAVVEAEEGARLVEREAAGEGAVKTESGMVYREILAGTGDSPVATDRVKVHYRGTLRDGTVFDSSYERGEPTEFALNQVVACWTEGLQLMKPGGKSRLVCPASLAYGDQGRPGIPGGATLIFEIELLEVSSAAPPAGG
jgi:FKBP-type peptidyl-prolyl cis-trans isomerase